MWQNYSKTRSKSCAIASFWSIKMCPFHRIIGEAKPDTRARSFSHFGVNCNATNSALPCLKWKTWKLH